METEIKKVIVAGAGVMGAGIAQVAAQSGYKVQLFDINQTMLDKGIEGINKQLDKAISLGKMQQSEKSSVLKNIDLSSDLSNCRGDIIIEAVVEKLEIKVQIFKQVLENNPAIILATNTSSIPITKIAAQVDKPHKVIGIHFFNPAHIMRLVEIIQGAQTSEDVKNKSYLFVKSLKKTPIFAKDAPGFIVNRVARHFYVESLKILEEQVADVSTIDNLMKTNGFKMGAFELMDLIGVETNLKVTESMFTLFNNDEKFRPSRIQQQKVDAGYFGRKTKKGFYDYE